MEYQIDNGRVEGLQEIFSGEIHQDFQEDSEDEFDNKLFSANKVDSYEFESMGNTISNLFKSKKESSYIK